MPWIRKEPPVVPSLEDNVTYAKRFTSLPINQLITRNSAWVYGKMKEYEINNIQKAIEFVIVNIDYPFFLGMPCDKHVWNGFCGKACYTIVADYWQTAEETLMTYVLNKKLYGRNGYGDCEDTSILLTSFLRLLSSNAYTIFGIVYRGNSILGGHGWVIAQLDDGKWHLVETTLDTPLKYPDEYPVVDSSTNIYKVGDLTYEGWIKFNDVEYYEWMEPGIPYTTLTDYVFTTGRRKRRREVRKYKEMEKAWKRPFKHRRIRGIGKIIAKLF